MTFDRDRFAEEVGSSFTLKGADGESVGLELAEVSELKERPHQVSFSMVFLTPKSYVIEQGLQDLQHERLGEMQIFLVPIGVSNERMQLEAIFNFVREDRP
jgi:hypothetical protein